MRKKDDSLEKNEKDKSESGRKYAYQMQNYTEPRKLCMMERLLRLTYVAPHEH